MYIIHVEITICGWKNPQRSTSPLQAGCASDLALLPEVRPLTEPVPLWAIYHKLSCPTNLKSNPVNQNYVPRHIVLAHLICSKHTLKMCFFGASAHFWPLSTFKMCLGVFREKIRGTLKMCSNVLNMCLDTFLASFHILNVPK